MHDAADKAAKRIEPEPEPAERLCKIPGRVDRADLAVIIRAVTLHLAYAADLDDDSLEKSGKALADICRVYLRYERSPRHAGQTPPREGNQAGA
jgi:hypothetical protein